MFHRILVPIDGSPTSSQGLEEAIALAKNQAARVCLLHVVDELVVTQGLGGAMFVSASYVEDFTTALRENGSKLLAKAEKRVRQHRVRVETNFLDAPGQRVADVIIKQAKKWRADVIVLGTHGRRGLSRVLMGSDAELVVREAPVPVLLVRATQRRRKRRVVRS